MVSIVWGGVRIKVFCAWLLSNLEVCQMPMNTSRKCSQIREDFQKIIRLEIILKFRESSRKSRDPAVIMLLCNSQAWQGVMSCIVAMTKLRNHHGKTLQVVSKNEQPLTS